MKVPEAQKEKLEEIAEEEGYPNRSEFLREVIRNEIKKRETIKKEVLEKIEERMERLEEGELSFEDLTSNKELEEELGIE